RPRRPPHRRCRRARQGLRRGQVERGPHLRHPDRRPHLPPQRPARGPDPGEGMTTRGLAPYWMLVPFLLLVAYPFLPDANANRGMQLVALFVFGLLTLGQNVVVGYTGLLHLGIAAYFGIGAYV